MFRHEVMYLLGTEYDTDTFIRFPNRYICVKTKAFMDWVETS